MVDEPRTGPVEYTDPLETLESQVEPDSTAAPATPPEPIVPTAPTAAEVAEVEPARAPAREGGWRPSLVQIAAALQGNLTRAIGPDPADEVFVRGQHSSMRQGVGLIVITGLISGLWRLILDWSTIAETGAILPLLRASDALLWVQRLFWWLPPVRSAAEAREMLGGLSAAEPGWLSGGLLALGPWLNQPLRLLALWLVYGLLVMIAVKVLGGRTTLPRFYAATAYAVTPLILTIVAPMPWVGPALSVVGWVAALVLYARAVRMVTDMEWGRTVLCVALPAILVTAIGLSKMLLLSVLTIV